MKDSSYVKHFLSEQHTSGPLWTYKYDFEKNSGSFIENETSKEYFFAFFHKTLTFFDTKGSKRYDSLLELERKWIDNCVSECLFLIVEKYEKNK